MFYEKTQGRVEIENSIVEAPIISLYTPVPGVLNSLPATEGHTVKTGDTLAVVGSNTLRSQTDGLVVTASNLVGGTVSTQAPVVQLINPNDMRIDGTIDENKGLNDIKIGQPVSFTVDALPGQTFWGYVDEVSATAKSQQVAFTISSERPTQQFQVYAKFDARHYPQIKNGMSAKMTVYTK